MDASQRFFDGNVVIYKIVWLSSCVCDPPDDLTELLEDDGDKLSELTGCPLSDVENIEDFLDWCGLNKKMGFLVHAKTPVPTDVVGDGYSFSWGWCQTEWFYADALDDDLIAELEKWQQRVVFDTKAKLAK